MYGMATYLFVIMSDIDVLCLLYKEHVNMRYIYSYYSAHGRYIHKFMLNIWDNIDNKCNIYARK